MGFSGSDSEVVKESKWWGRKSGSGYGCTTDLESELPLSDTLFLTSAPSAQPGVH